MRKNNNPYLSFAEGLGVTIILVILIAVTRRAWPFMYENLILYPVTKILIFGGIIYIFVQTKKLSTDYLFPKRKIEESVGTFMGIIISCFLFQRIVTDLIDLLSIGYEQFLSSREGNLYPFKQRGIKHFISLVIVGPMMEELMFRGLIFRGFLKHYNAIKSIVLSSLLFAILHTSPDKYFFSSLFFSFLLAGFLCWITLKTENLRIAIGCHMLWNFINYIFLPAIFTMLKIEVRDIFDFAFVFLIMFAIAVVLLFFGYRWIRKHYSSFV